MDPFPLLRHLSDGEFHSGADLARQIQVSRGTIWNALRAARQFGVEVFAVRGRGYRLPVPPDWLDRGRILDALGPQESLFRLEILDTTPSTNSLLLERAQAGAAHGTVIAAELQTQGRGRLGRSWQGELGGGLAFSLLWRFREGVGFLGGLSLAAGCAVARAIDRLGAEEVGLKWPNDVLWRGGKLAGILIESRGDLLGPTACVIGVGLNVRASAALRAQVAQPVADLAEALPRPTDRSRIFAAVLAALGETLETFGRHGFAPFRDEWQQRNVWQGRQTYLNLPSGETVAGVCEGVAEDGSLLLRAPAGLRRYPTGEMEFPAAPRS